MGEMDLATVFYAGDVLLMQLQARSMARFMDTASIGSIKLIENDEPDAISQQDRDQILQQYEHLRDKVEFIPRENLGYRPTTAGGWRIQQALKLAIGHKCEQDFVVLLDCKNHLIRPASFESFVTDDLRARQYFSRKYDPQQAKWLERSWAYFGIERTYVDENLPSTITPYPIQTQILRDLVDEIAARDGSIFELMGCDNFGGTEFYLLLAYVQWRFGEVSEIYDNSLLRPATLFSNWPQKPQDVDMILALAERGETNFFAIHSKRQISLNSDEWLRVRKLWNALDLTISEVVEYYENKMDYCAPRAC